MLADTEEVALSFEQTNLSSGSSLQTTKLRHPIALFFHFVFRTLAILLYVFANLFFNSFITIFVIMIILLSMDFWTVKNISGRLLVGLRWWNHVDEDGKSHWIFENRKNNQQTSNLIQQNVESTVEVTLFWASLFAVDAFWILFFLISVLTFSFKWMTIIITALMFNGSNTYGFLKCRYGSDSNLKSVASGLFGKQILQSVFQKMSGNTQQPPQSNPQTSN